VTSPDESEPRSKLHQAVVDLLIDHFSLMDSAESDMDEQPILRDVLDSEYHALDYLLTVLKQKLGEV
jgi:hypothetical protein